MPDVFMDTGHVIGFLRDDDEHHLAALYWSLRVRRERWRRITTTAVVAEVGDAFSKDWHVVRVYLQTIFTDPLLEIVAVDADLLGRAVDLRDGRLDKDWGLTDCISFVVMQERGLSTALAADRHFQQAGFRALLREDAPAR